MKTIALISPVNPAPCTGDEKLRVVHLAQCLKQAGFAVSLIICDTKFSGPPPEELFQFFDKIKVVPPPARRSLFKRLLGLFFGSSVPRYPDLAAGIAAALDEWQPSAVHVIKTFLSAQINLNALRKKGMLTVMDAGGIHHLVYLQKAMAADTPSKYRLWFKRSMKLKTYEACILSDFDAVTATNTENQSLLQEMNPSATVILAPDGRDENPPDSRSELSPGAARPAWSDCMQKLVDFYRQRLGDARHRPPESSSRTLRSSNPR